MIPYSYHLCSRRVIYLLLYPPSPWQLLQRLTYLTALYCLKPRLQTHDSINTAFVDPFAAVPLRSFDGSDSFGLSTTHSESVPAETKPNHTNDDSFGNFDEKYSTETVPKKNTFQVKSGIWADSLSRGLIHLNISAPKKVPLVDVGVMGGLSDGFEEKEKGRPISHYMGQAMGTGSGLGRSGSGFTSSQGTDMDDFFSSQSSNNHQSQFGNFQK